MALTKDNFVVSLETQQDGKIVIKRAILIYEDGELIARKTNRQVVTVPANADANTPAVQNVINSLLDNARILASRSTTEGE
jgi:hypothetical protein